MTADALLQAARERREMLELAAVARAEAGAIEIALAQRGSMASGPIRVDIQGQPHTFTRSGELRKRLGERLSLILAVAPAIGGDSEELRSRFRTEVGDPAIASFFAVRAARDKLRRLRAEAADLERRAADLITHGLAPHPKTRRSAIALTAPV